jgi:hypothetical protein
VSGQAPIPLQITVDGQRRRSETTACSVGAYVFVIATVLPDFALDLHSTYTGHQRTGTIAVHLVLDADAYNTLIQEHDHDELPVGYAQRRCLYDHLHRLQELLEERGHLTSIPVEENAITAIES